MDNLDTGNCEQTGFMVDSGAGEIVAWFQQVYIGYCTIETIATGTEHSSASSGGAAIKNAGEECINVMAASGVWELHESTNVQQLESK